MAGAALHLHDVEAVDDRPCASRVAPRPESQGQLGGRVELEPFDALGRAAREGEVLPRRVGEALLVVDGGQER
ncbi:MAG TPA: hypothetical protein VGG39_26890 [Polyangiaceae bacterium]